MDSDIYEIERIVGDKVIKGKQYFLIKWAGYSNKENTWEPEENIDQGSIDEYRTGEITNDWNGKVDTIEKIYFSKKHLIAEIKFLGKKKIVNILELKKRCPLLLIDFYEKHIEFN